MLIFTRAFRTESTRGQLISPDVTWYISPDLIWLQVSRWPCVFSVRKALVDMSIFRKVKGKLYSLIVQMFIYADSLDWWCAISSWYQLLYHDQYNYNIEFEAETDMGRHQSSPQPKSRKKMYTKIQLM